MATILLTGDVMLGRGIDQILQHPNSPELYEPFVRSALDYVALAERRNGPIVRRVGYAYVWGDALPELRSADVRIVNLETTMTRAGKPAPKGINYRCNPANVPCLEAARIDCCVLSNNHVLDWGEEGLIETLDTLERADIQHAGAGRDLTEAEAPAMLQLPGGGRLLVHALGAPSSGVPASWAAGPGHPGVNYLGDFDRAFDRLRPRIAAEKQEGDVVIVSIHWGSNWGYEIPDSQRRFAHRLIDEAAVDIVHGHSSHHARMIELFSGKPILYGCGDFLNDYEGISGEEEYRPDLVLAYRMVLEAGGRLSSLELLPFRIVKFRLQRATHEEARWLAATLDRECRLFGGRVAPDGSVLRFSAQAELH